MTLNTQRSIDEATFTVSSAVIYRNSPLEQWIEELDDPHLAELYIHHFAYAWMYLLDNNLVPLTEKCIMYYLGNAYFTVRSYHPIDEEKFFEIYPDRYLHLKEELHQARRSVFALLEFFPGYFYGRVLYHPLDTEDFKVKSTLSGDTYYGIWSDEELSGMFAHHINHLQQALDAAFT